MACIKWKKSGEMMSFMSWSNFRYLKNILSLLIDHIIYLDNFAKTEHVFFRCVHHRSTVCLWQVYFLKELTSKLDVISNAHIKGLLLFTMVKIIRSHWKKLTKFIVRDFGAPYMETFQPCSKLLILLFFKSLEYVFRVFLFVLGLML